jgi:hypothetical protein
MIGLTEKHYAAIGRVAVESCTLDREVGEYLTRLGALPRRRLMLGDKLTLLRKTVPSRVTDTAANRDFMFALTNIGALIDRRNALAHGVWISDVLRVRQHYRSRAQSHSESWRYRLYRRTTAHRA